MLMWGSLWDTWRVFLEINGLAGLEEGGEEVK